MARYRRRRQLLGGAMLLLLFMGLLWICNAQKGDLREIYRQESKRYQQILGALLSEYPKKESEIIRSLFLEGDDTWENLGRQTLEKYGYWEETEFQRHPFYSWLLWKIGWRNTVFFAFLALCMGIGGAGMYFIYKKQMRQAGQMAEDFMAGDFKRARQQELDRNLEGRLAGRMLQLGRQLETEKQTRLKERESIKELITDLSHQLKTPLASLKTCLSIAQEAQNGEEREEFLGLCQEQSDKLENLMESLIHLSRLEVAMIQLNPKPTELMELLVGAVNSVYGKARERQIELELEEFDSFYVNVDPKWTIEALVNVLDNGVKYSKPGGRILIKAEKRQAFAWIEITDQGIGISKNELTKIFGRFYRGKSAKVSQEEGAGIGLYLTRKIVEDQGGSIFVRSGEGEGSSFILQLPLFLEGL